MTLVTMSKMQCLRKDENFMREKNSLWINVATSGVDLVSEEIVAVLQCSKVTDVLSVSKDSTL